MKKILASLLLVLAACGQDNTATETPDAASSETPEVAKIDYTKHSGLLLEHMNLDIRPGDDFNAFVNGGWIAEITASSHLKDVYAKTGRTGTMVFIVWETTFSNHNGQVVAEVQESLQVWFAKGHFQDVFT